jgi:hypothetical protein
MAHAAFFTEVMDDRAEDLQVVLDILEDVGADCTLIGGLAVGYHGYQRATIDVDMLVPARFLKRVASAAQNSGYVVRSFPGMLRIYAPGAEKSFADIVSSDANPVLRAAFKEAEPATVLGQQLNVVRLGALCALKFHAAVSPSRKIEDKYQDIADIGHVIKRLTSGDETDARRIAALVYPGAEKDFVVFLDDLRHGRSVRF